MLKDLFSDISSSISNNSSDHNFIHPSGTHTEHNHTEIDTSHINHTYTDHSGFFGGDGASFSSDTSSTSPSAE
jgi:hypothetical protein